MKRWMLPACCALVAALAMLCATAWLKADHDQSEPVRVAREFVRLMEVRQFPQAYALTTKDEVMGRTATRFEQSYAASIYHLPLLRGTSPRQSHGNRLRRWYAGVPLDMPRVDVELDGYAPLRLTMRRTPDGAWRVAAIASHAG